LTPLILCHWVDLVVEVAGLLCHLIIATTRQLGDQGHHIFGRHNKKLRKKKVFVVGLKKFYISSSVFCTD